MEEKQIHMQPDRHRRRYQTEKTTVNGVVHSTQKPSHTHKDHTEGQDKDI